VNHAPEKDTFLGTCGTKSVCFGLELCLWRSLWWVTKVRIHFYYNLLKGSNLNPIYFGDFLLMHHEICEMNITYDVSRSNCVGVEKSAETVHLYVKLQHLLEAYIE